MDKTLAEMLCEAFDDSLVRTPTERATSLRMPVDDLTFITQVGLPAQEILGFRFNLVEALPLLPELDRHTATGELTKCVSLGEENQVVTALDPDGGWRVILIGLDKAGHTTSVNSSVRYLGMFLAQCVFHWRRILKGAVPLEESYRELRVFMEQHDPEALTRADSYWSVVCEQLEIGML